MKNESDKLDEFMADHQNDFDLFDPPADLWGKIADEIQRPELMAKPNGEISEAQKKRKRIIRMFAVQGLTAAAVFFAMFFYYSPKQGGTVIQGDALSASNETVEITADVIGPEFAETEAYFKAELASRVNKVSGYAEKYPDVYKDIITDLEELQGEYDELKSDLKDNMANAEIVESMIQNYRIRLEILEDLLEKLNENEDDNSPINEI